MAENKRKPEESPSMLFIVITVIMVVALAAVHKYYKAQCNVIYQYEYDLQEIDDGVYAICYDVRSNVPAKNYSTVKICYGNQLHTYEGKVSIFYTDQLTYVEIIERPKIVRGDEIILYVPWGSIEYQETVGLK